MLSEEKLNVIDTRREFFSRRVSGEKLLTLLKTESGIIKFDVFLVGARYIVPVQIVIYDVLGREITTLVNQNLTPGTPACRSLGAGRYEVEFNARANGSSLPPSGVYFYRVIIKTNASSPQANPLGITKKMILIK